MSDVPLGTCIDCLKPTVAYHPDQPQRTVWHVKTAKRCQKCATLATREKPRALYMPPKDRRAREADLIEHLAQSPATIREIAERYEVNVATVSQWIARLRRAGYIRQVGYSTDTPTKPAKLWQAVGEAVA
jgi:predicted Rossmann fold nucleotide-binding protein DprA/Smf involved in DNA uptake